MQWRPISEVPPEYKTGGSWCTSKPIIVGWAGTARFEKAKWVTETVRGKPRNFWCWNHSYDHAGQAANPPTHFMIPDPIPEAADD